MEKKISVCEICSKRAEDEKQKRRENWLTMNGGCVHGISVWLEKPRRHKKGVSEAYVHTVGLQYRAYDFCSIKCSLKALERKDSI